MIGSQNKNEQVIDNMRLYCCVFLLILADFVIAQDVQPRSERYNFYTEEIRAVAPNIPVQPELVIKDAQEYRMLMELWASKYPDEYRAVWKPVSYTHLTLPTKA